MKNKLAFTYILITLLASNALAGITIGENTQFQIKEDLVFAAGENSKTYTYDNFKDGLPVGGGPSWKSFSRTTCNLKIISADFDNSYVRKISKGQIITVTDQAKTYDDSLVINLRNDKNTTLQLNCTAQNFGAPAGFNQYIHDIRLAIIPSNLENVLNQFLIKYSEGTKEI